MELETIFLDENNYMKFRPTPWDSKIFGFSTNEIMEFHYSDLQFAAVLFEKFSSKCQEVNCSFTSFRISADDVPLKGFLHNSGYYYCETSFLLTKTISSKEDFGKIFQNDLVLEVPDENDFIQIKNIAYSSFKYSRYHEDHKFRDSLASERYLRWIDELITQEKKFIVYKLFGSVVSFLAYSVYSNEAHLILAGTESAKGYISFKFWASFLTYFQKQNITRVYTNISAANIGIVNLYARMSFKFEKTFLDFHKFH